MNKKPEFSVIIPVYNSEKYLPRCLESVLKQIFIDYECILIDDGSTDKSGKICDEYAEKDKRFSVIHQKNKGVSASRNAGLDVSQGDWCVFVDSDDFLEQNHLEEFSKETADITYTCYKMFDENENEISTRIVEPIFADEKNVHSAIRKILNEKNFFGIIWTKKFNMEIIRKFNIRFDEKVCISEDILFTHDFLQHAKSLSVISVPTYNYTFRTSSLSHGGTNLFDETSFLQEYSKLISTLDYQKDILDEIKIWFKIRLDNLVCTSFRLFSKWDSKTKSAVKNLCKFLNKNYDSSIHNTGMGLFVYANFLASEKLLKKILLRNKRKE